MKRRHAALLLLLAAPAGLPAAPPPSAQHTYANPLDLDYRYDFEQLNRGISYRSGADPALVRHRDAYYLFATLADGYWRSTDLIHWAFITPSRWPTQGVVAPAVASDGKRLVLMPASTKPQALFYSEQPQLGRLEFLTRLTPPLPDMMSCLEEARHVPGKIPPGPWDPGLLRDDDGRWYLYWNSSNVYPIYGIKLDPQRALAYEGRATALLRLDPRRHGWERFGQDHCGCEQGKPTKPFIEGAWMSKVGGRYYLQYAAPGSEYNVYANGTYVGEHPLGPFRYADYNPVAYKPGGFVEGAGHGSTFEDAYGNYWNTGTAWIGYNWKFERRIEMLPAFFYPDGQMAVSARFGDFPHFVPTHRYADPDSLFTGWMLLSYRKRASASSTRGEFSPDRVTDENPRSFWVAASNRPGETLTVDLGAAMTVRAVQVNFADYESGRYGAAPDVYTAFTLQGSLDGRQWTPLAGTGEERRDRPNAYFELPAPVSARYVRYVHGHVGAANLAISDLRVFGSANGAPPAAPAQLRAVREHDPRNARIAWQAVPGVVGYNVRWGIRPDRLTLTWQLFAADATREFGGRQHGNRLELRALNAGVPYYVAVEAFNESGVSPLSPVVELH